MLKKLARKRRLQAREGDHVLICDRSGFKIKRSDARKTWDGLMVHKRFWEPRHPQDFVRGVQERIGVKDARPESEISFVTHAEVSAEDL